MLGNRERVRLERSTPALHHDMPASTIPARISLARFPEWNACFPPRVACKASDHVRPDSRIIDLPTRVSDSPTLLRKALPFLRGNLARPHLPGEGIECRLPHAGPTGRDARKISVLGRLYSGYGSAWTLLSPEVEIFVKEEMAILSEQAKGRPERARLLPPYSYKGGNERSFRTRKSE